MLIDRRSLAYFDWVSFLLIALISCIGLLFVFSATYRPEAPFSLFFKKQCLGLLSAWVLYFFCSIMNYRTLMRLGYFMCIALVGILLFTIIKGSVALGGQRWINLFFFKVQPSELAKILFPAFFVYFLYTEKEVRHAYSLKELWPLLLMLGVLGLLVLKQPDLGTAVIVCLVGIIMLWLIGVPQKFFIIGAIVATLCAPIAWHVLKDYQKQRIAVFLGYGDPHKERYQIEQSKIAIGSGGFGGKGFLHGTQNKFLFLPESRTDFIFAVLCEEWGFIGALLMIVLYLTLFFRMFLLIQMIPNFFSQLLAIGVMLHVILSVFINMAMAIGLAPVVGIPLPLMSYGISNLWVTFISLGWCSGIIMQQ
jgi:rod shape determining protein RodA